MQDIKVLEVIILSDKLKDAVFCCIASALVGGVDTVIAYVILTVIGVSIALWCGALIYFICATVAFTALVFCCAAKDVPPIEC